MPDVQKNIYLNRMTKRYVNCNERIVVFYIDIYTNASPAFMSKVIEKVIAFQLHSHMTQHNMFEELQSTYKAHHSTETTPVTVFNDIKLNLDSGSGSFLILLDLSSAFDTIDYDLLCTVFERHLGISGTTLKLLKSF